MTQGKVLDKDEHFSYANVVPDIICELTGFDDPKKQPERYATYVLECEGYDDDAYETDIKFKNDWEKWARTNDFEGYSPHEPEGWAWAAFYADRVFYVGQTKSLYHRLLDHQGAPEKTSMFNVVFKPMSLERVEWHETREQALKREKELAEKYSDRSEGWFSYYA